MSCSKKESVPSASPNGPTGSVTREQSLLIEAVKQTGGQSANGKVDSLICELSEKHLDYMIEQGQISHDGFQERSKLIAKKGGGKTAEIVAYNCGQGTLQTAAKQCAKSWRNSPGHWAHMEPYWDGFCYAMKQSQDGCTYCIGLFGNGKF